MAFYTRYRNITKGQPFLNRQQFAEVLNSFNIYPNQNVADRMFAIVDKDGSSKIDFIEFMRYIVLMLDGTEAEKSGFIFKMIAFQDKEEFTIFDLIEFYKMINVEEDLSRSRLPETTDDETNQAEEMAQVVFEMMDISVNDRIDENTFIEFIKNEKRSVELFNFFNTDMETTTKNIRTKNSFLNMVQTLKGVKQDLEELENILFPQFNSNLRKKSVNKKKSRFNQTFHSVLKEKIKEDPPLEKKLSINYTKCQTDKIRKPFMNKKSELSNFANIEIPIEIHSESENTNILDPESQLSYKLTERKSTFHNERNLRSIFMSISTKVENLMDDLEKEIEVITKEEEFSFHLKKDFNRENITNDNKKLVFLNNSNWNIVTTMISGIHKSLSIVAFDKCHTIKKSNFKFHNKIEIEAVYSSQFDKCKFKDYAPYVFQSIRRQFGISYESYIRSIGVDTFQNAFFDKLYLMLSEESTGKSGSFFFHTSDSKYMIKTIRQSEFEVLRNILPNYHEHILKNPNTILTRYFGLHQMKCYNKNKLIYDIYIVVMNNIFTMDNPSLLRHKYDLKGSTFGRRTKQEDIDLGAAKKDLDFISENMQINVAFGTKQKLIEQISADTGFLSRHNIIDYSMLIGIIDADENEIEFNRPLFRTTLFDQPQTRKSKKRKGNTYIESYDKRLHYYIGIIDTLTSYGIKKKGEYMAKRVFQGSGVSCVPPKDYKKRFVRFMEKAIGTDL